ncbi:MAG: invasion associated locus B family protein [Betaproteobacteria bacterium]|nr:invasion associated locus B family protein [Betaproteobacteria bacterium]
MSIATRTLPLLVASLFACTFAAGAADTPGPKLEQFDDWGLRCVTPPGRAEICELIQDRIATRKDAGKDAPGQWLAGVVLSYAAGNDNLQMLIRTRLPVGVAPGVQFSVPGMAQPARIPFNYCDEKGCSTVRVALEAEVVQKIKDSEAAFAQDPNAPQPMLAVVLAIASDQGGSRFQGVDIPLSSKGFTQASSRLKAPSAPAAAK